jgi:hypothetical protein
VNDVDFGQVAELLAKPVTVPSEPRHKIKNYTLTDGLLWFQEDRLCILRNDALRYQLLHDHHDAAGHLRIDKTYLAMHGHVYCPRMYNDVEKYVKSCDKCQRNKAINDKPIGLLQPLPVPARP